MVTKDAVLEALGAIIDPDLDKDIVTLGFIANLEIEGPHILVEIRITTPACPVRDEFKTAAEKLVGALPGVETVTVTISSQAARSNARANEKSESGLANVGALIAIASCKGGVGKSTVAAALARELAQRGHRVGLLDTDIFGPSLPTLFNRHEQELESGPGNMLLPAEVNGLKVMSFGFWLGDSPAVMRGPMVTNYVQQFLHGVAWGELDYLLLDLPPGTGDIQLTITQAVRLDGAVVVTTPQPLAIADVRKGILMFEKVDVPVLGIIENMAYFQAGDVRYPVFGTDGATGLQESFGVDLLGRLPLDPEQYGRTFDVAAAIPEISDAVDAMVRAVGSASVGREPVAVDFDAARIQLTWPEGRSVAIANLELRANCRCANCVNEFTGERTNRRDAIRPDIKAEEVRTVGNYAISVKWNDGHSTGLFPYRTIEQLAKTVAQPAAPSP
jgi:ATP-binding protein involved in chromosome partitioning